MDNIDVAKIKSEHPCIEVVKRITSSLTKKTQGGELTGPCPFCMDGDDRFNVHPQKGWLCRYCTDGKWQDVIALAAKHLGLDCRRDFVEVCEWITGRTYDRVKPVVVQKKKKVREMPNQDWMDRATKCVEQFHNSIWGTKGHKYYNDRGITDETISALRLGYCTSKGEYFGHWFYTSLIIPIFLDGQVIAIKARLGRQGKEERGKPEKYVMVTGGFNHGYIYNIDMLGKGGQCIVTEGEFDAIVLWQELEHYIPVITTGSSTMSPDKRFTNRLLPIEKFFICADNDKEGESCRNKWKSFVGDRAIDVYLPSEYKDVNECHLEGNSLQDWASRFLDEQSDNLPLKWDGFSDWQEFTGSNEGKVWFSSKEDMKDRLWKMEDAYWKEMTPFVEGLGGVVNR